MLSSALGRLVGFCIRHVLLVILSAIALAALLGTYGLFNFAIDTDVNDLISRDLPWRKREIAYNAAFPQTSQSIIIVIDGKTPEQTAAAGEALTQTLSDRTTLFRSVQELQGGEFFQKNGLLFLPLQDVEQRTTQLIRAKPLIAILAKDPSLRGLVKALSLSIRGIRAGFLPLDKAAPAFDQISATLEKIAKPAFFHGKNFCRRASTE